MGNEVSVSTFFPGEKWAEKNARRVLYFRKKVFWKMGHDQIWPFWPLGNGNEYIGIIRHNVMLFKLPEILSFFIVCQDTVKTSRAGCARE